MREKRLFPSLLDLGILFSLISVFPSLLDLGLLFFSNRSLRGGRAGVEERAGVDDQSVSSPLLHFFPPFSNLSLSLSLENVLSQKLLRFFRVVRVCEKLSLSLFFYRHITSLLSIYTFSLAAARLHLLSDETGVVVDAIVQLASVEASERGSVLFQDLGRYRFGCPPILRQLGGSLLSPLAAEENSRAFSVVKTSPPSRFIEDSKESCVRCNTACARCDRLSFESCSSRRLVEKL